MYKIMEPNLIEYDKKKKEYYCQLSEKDFFSKNGESEIEKHIDSFINNIILKDKTFTTGIYSGAVGLVSKFGSGKSFFMHVLFCKILSKKDDTNPNYHIYPVYIDISKYENNFQRLLVLIFAEITKSISSKKSRKRKNKLDIIKTILPIAAKLGFKLWTKKIQGIDEELINASGEIGEGLAQYLVETLDEEEIYLEKLKNLSKDTPLVILIDNLDRCRPEFVLDFFVLMKRMFSVDNILFIVAYDKQQIINLLKTLYGSQVDISSYMRKYISFEFSPPQENLMIRDFTLRSCEEIDSKIDFSNFLKMSPTVVRNSKDFEHLSLMVLLWENIYSSTRLSLRQYQHGLALTLKIYSIEEEKRTENEDDIDFLYYLFDILIIYMKITHPYQYQNFQNYLLWNTKKNIEGIKIIQMLEIDNNFSLDFENIIYSMKNFIKDYNYLRIEKSDNFLTKEEKAKHKKGISVNLPAFLDRKLEDIFEFYFTYEERDYIDLIKQTIANIENLMQKI